jgi:hypothetical protein
MIANRFMIIDPEKDLLGRGGMGEVYRATNTRKHRGDMSQVLRIRRGTATPCPFL